MAGLLDMLMGEQSPEQRQGLLAAAAQMLNDSGLSRTPRSVGQIMAGGVKAYQTGLGGAQDQAYKLQLRKQQMDEATLAAADKARARQQQDAINAAARESLQTQGQQAIGMPGQAGPTLDKVALIPDQTGGFDQEGFIRRVMAVNPLKALELQKSLVKAGPEYTDKVQTGIDPATNKPFQYILSKSGEMKRLDSLPRDKLELMNRGGSEQAYNPYSLTSGQSFTKTPTFAEQNASSRLAFDRTQADAPQYMDTQDGIVALPKRLKPGQQPTGVPVMGANGAPLEKRQNIPQFVTTGVTGNAKSLSIIDNALASLATKEGKDAVGYKGYLPNSLLNRMYPDGTETRADISDVGSLVLHDRSGAAVTAAESPRLMPFIPLATDDAATSTKKLKRMKQLIEAETNNLTFAYPQAAKLAKYAAENAPSNKDGSASAPEGKTATLADIAATARASGKTTAEVTAAMRAKGYTIGGQ